MKKINFIAKETEFFIVECMLFTKPLDGVPIPNFILGIVAWLQVGIIAKSII